MQVIPFEHFVCKVQSVRYRLSKYRLDANLTQAQVADALEISQGLYNQLENGKRRMNDTYLDKLAKLYGVSPVDLIIDPMRDDPLYSELDQAFRQLSPAEKQILVASAKGIISARQTQ